MHILDTEVKNEIQDCPETENVPSNELYVDENIDDKEHEFSEMEKTDYSTLYGTNQYYNRCSKLIYLYLYN